MRKRWLKRLLDIKWQSKVTNNEVLKQVNLAREPALQVDIATPYHEERLQGRPRSLGNIPVSDRPQAVNQGPVKKFVVTLAEKVEQKRQQKKEGEHFNKTPSFICKH